MKGVWITVCVLAIANLLGVVGFVAWLYASDRLNDDRVQRIRSILGETITAETARLGAERKQEEEAQRAREQAARFEGDPESAAAAIQRQRQEAEVRQATILRLREEISQLQAELVRARESADAEKRQIESARRDLDARRNALDRTRASEQFRQVLSALEAQRPGVARQILQAMLDAGRRDEVLEYLAAMQDEARAKVVAEFAKADERLAADLLSELRVRGVTHASP